MPAESQARPSRDISRALAAFQDDGGFFFWGGGRDTQLRLLGHLIRYSNLLLVLTAPTGAGKTALIRAFMRSDTTGLSTWLLQAQEFMRADALWAQLCANTGQLKRALGEAPAGRVEALRQLAADCQAENTIGVLIVDDAHLLAEDALEFLADASVALKDSEALRIVLAGEPELQSHLEHSRLIERMQGNCHHLVLDPLDEACARDYVGQRLGSHGLTVDFFSESELGYILNQSRGLPGEIGVAVSRVLRGGVPADSPRNFPVIPRAHVFAIVAVLVLILATYLFSGAEDADPELSAGALGNPVTKRITAPQIVNARPELDRHLQAGDGLASLPVSEQAALAPIPTGPPETTTTKPHATKPDTTETVALPPPSRKPPKEAGTTTAKTAATAEPEPAKSDVQAPTATAERAPLSLAPDIAAPGSVPAQAADSPEQARIEDFLAGRKPQQRTEDWLLEQSPGSYTVQVLGAGNEQAVAKFIDAQEEPEKFIYFRTTLKGRDWFVVVIGLYGNRAEAVASIQTLPQSLRKNRPWARSLESIHKAIVEDRPA